jgi:hypothetical protein
VRQEVALKAKNVLMSSVGWALGLGGCAVFASEGSRHPGSALVFLGLVGFLAGSALAIRQSLWGILVPVLATVGFGLSNHLKDYLRSHPEANIGELVAVAASGLGAVLCLLLCLLLVFYLRNRAPKCPQCHRRDVMQYLGTTADGAFRKSLYRCSRCSGG